MSVELKIEAKSLAAKARIIKKEEQKLLTEKRIGSRYHLLQRVRASPSLKLHQMGTVNWQNEYARLVEQFEAEDRKHLETMGDNYKASLEARRKAAEAGFSKVREYRVNVIRPQARATHLARMILKGIPYRNVESRTDDQVNKMTELQTRVTSLVRHYSSGQGEKFSDFSQKDFKAWISVPKSQESQKLAG